MTVMNGSPVFFEPRLSASEAGLWSGAAAVVLAAHLLFAYAYYASAPEETSAEVAEQALTIDLAPIPMATPESVATESARERNDIETLEPLETSEPSPLEEAVKTVGPLTAEKTATVEPDVPMDDAAKEAPEAVETMPDAVDTLEPLPDEMLPLAEVPMPTPRPALDRPITKTAEHTKPHPEKPRAAETVRQGKQPVRPAAPASPPPTLSSAASSAPRISPARWQTRVLAWLNRHKRYPSGARARRQEGTVTVSFTIDPSGRVLATRVIRSSGNAELDTAAVDMVQRSSPVPAPPAQIARSRMNLSVPVDFSLR